MAHPARAMRLMAADPASPNRPVEPASPYVQQMPVAFFGRVQTGALVNRLVTDATGARSAFTEVLSTVIQWESTVPRPRANGR